MKNSFGVEKLRFMFYGMTKFKILIFSLSISNSNCFFSKNMDGFRDG